MSDTATPMVVLSYMQANILHTAHQAGHSQVQVSLDLGLSTATVALDAAGVYFPGGQFLAWEQIDLIAASDVNCFLVEADSAHKVQAFSPWRNCVYSLMPTAGAPTMLIAGFPMHRIKGTDPHQDTLRKIRAAGGLRGRVLDTTTGLGYTAIEAARTAAHVTTIEIDPTALDIARLNPWSQPLFDNPAIEQHIGDASEIVPRLDEASFSRIIHDPPTFQLAGELYSGAFYRHLLRVLKPGGRLFHYIGSLDSKSGQGTMRGVVRRLQEAGFERVVKKPDAFGVVAFRS